ncbi:MAG: 4-hydroxybenzoate decarboxylase subunit C [Bacteroidia bacterium]|nr:4-hydroxybenzoate decarboxylase subunit C [Bacteroidia bacterium]
MGYSSLRECINDLEKHKHLVRIKEEVDPNLEMAAIHLRVFEAGGPAVYFENVKGCKFPAVSNLFGTIERSKFIFRDTLETVKKLVALKADPTAFLKNPFEYAGLPLSALNALPLKKSYISHLPTHISALPQIKCWEKDGGAFITLPQVYTEDIDKPGVQHSNLGMYRIQLSGNYYIQDKEIGLHYQLHRGIGVHQTKANAKGQPLKVSIFVGGPPSHSFAAVMPLPEGLSELMFAGVLGGRRFRYSIVDGYVISYDADFVITGEVYPNENKPEGPFGDHLGYYSLKHDFPVLRVHKVYQRKDAIYPFTVVGRPPQEDTAFGNMIHEIAGPMVPASIPGLYDVHAVDASGVHPLLLALGSERYTPYINERKPQEILTIANHILGFNQMSLAKYLIIAAKNDNPDLDTHDIPAFFKHVLERVDWTRDLHFHTRTTIDTLDYSGTDLNSGSKVVIAAAGEKKRELGTSLPSDFTLPEGFSSPKIAMPGVLVIQVISNQLSVIGLEKHFSLNTDYRLPNTFPLIILADNSDFVAQNLNNFLWVTFTRSNPSHDIYGVDSFTEHKHWGCRGSLIIDARIKPHHAPVLEKNQEIEKRVDALGAKGKSLHGII